MDYPEKKRNSKKRKVVFSGKMQVHAVGENNNTINVNSQGTRVGRN